MGNSGSITDRSNAEESGERDRMSEEILDRYYEMHSGQNSQPLSTGSMVTFKSELCRKIALWRGIDQLNWEEGLVLDINAEGRSLSKLGSWQDVHVAIVAGLTSGSADQADMWVEVVLMDSRLLKSAKSTGSSLTQEQRMLREFKADVGSAHIEVGCTLRLRQHLRLPSRFRGKSRYVQLVPPFRCLAVAQTYSPYLLVSVCGFTSDRKNIEERDLPSWALVPVSDKNESSESDSIESSEEEVRRRHSADE